VCTGWVLSAVMAHGAVIWSDAGSRVIHKTPVGSDLLGGILERDNKSSDALYFKFQVDPLSDVANEEYYAVFQLFEGREGRLAVGNAPESWGYSAFQTAETGPENKVAGEYNLKSSQPEAAALGEVKPYELPRQGQPRTIIFKVQFVPGGEDIVTVWLSPRLTRGYSEDNQPEELTTKFKANASFDEIHLRHEGGGNGWVFSNMAVATSFNDFLVVRFWQTYWFIGGCAFFVLAAVSGTVRMVERKKYLHRLLLAEQERALERERTRIARDLHDELGSYLARISLLSGLARADATQPEQVQTHVEKIAEAADETVRALEEIVWAVRPGSDTVQSLMEYITHFAGELFEGSRTRCRLDMPALLPAHGLAPEIRHNIFLVVKEALTNVLKHASAKEVIIQGRVTDDDIEITVRDDGHGFVQENRRQHGQGLGNMERRAEAASGSLTVIAEPGAGTTVSLKVHLNQIPNGKKP
jgi:signal transduction histidine kinase